MDAIGYNAELGKLLKGLKKTLGATSINTNYRGTGSKAYARQYWIRFANGAVLDVFLENGVILLGGVVWINPRGERVMPAPSRIEYTVPSETYEKVVEVLRAWMAPAAEHKEAV